MERAGNPRHRWERRKPKERERMSQLIPQWGRWLTDSLGLLSIHRESWHFKFFPAPFLLVGWNVLDVGGNPPNVAAGVFDAAIPFT